jgi:hypothetical protein
MFNANISYEFLMYSMRFLHLIRLFWAKFSNMASINILEDGEAGVTLVSVLS